MLFHSHLSYDQRLTLPRPAQRMKESMSMDRKLSTSELYRVLLLLTACAAFLLRFLAANGEWVRPHLWGDSTHYMYYAYNLYKHSVFSSSPIGTPHPLADGFDSPAYPFLVSLFIRFGGDAWFKALLVSQCLLGTLTVVVSAILARRIFGHAAAIGVALVIAFWPHLVVISAWVLTETLFGTLLITGLWMSVRLTERGGKIAAMGTGFVWGLAALTNPVASLMPALLAVPIGRLRGWRLAALMVIAGSLFPAAWAIRNHDLPTAASSTGRALMNFVQGSWPEYHRAIHIGRTPQEAIIADLINQQVGVTVDHPTAGLAQIGQRLAGAPARYLQWYLLQKPYLLWDWRIRVGAGGPDGIEVAPLSHSPYRFIPLLGLSLDVYRTLNPLVFVLALLGIFWAAWRWSTHTPALVFAAITAVYATVVYSVLQAEPRYSIPYRPLEVLLACAGVAMLREMVRAIWHSKQSKQPYSPQ
jgi:4-amino-4-deoxy-L-arabinose transferase-like glycosyltransferase